MTYDELRGWELYVKQNGPLHLAIRIEAIIARAVSPFLKNVSARRFMQWPVEEEKEATPEDLMAILRSAKVKKEPKRGS